MSTLKVNTVQHNTSGFDNVVQFTDGAGTENGQLARAWVNFNAQGTVAIRADFNVNTVTDGGVGQFVVNFSSSMPDAHYAATGNSGHDVQFNSGTCTVDFSVPSTSNISMTVEDVDGPDVDKPYNYAAIFR